MSKRFNEEFLNSMFHVFVNDPDIPLHKFSEKDTVELYLYLLGMSEERIEYAYAIYVKNILQTLTKLRYQINSPQIKKI